MKQYNLKATKRQLSFGELTVIALGEKGRGRYENLVPFQGDIAESDFVIPVPTKTGKTKIIKGGDSKGWIARISCEGCYTRGTTGYASFHKKDVDKVTVLASGNGAEGDAGRIGWWADYLLQIEDETLIRVKQHGGYKTPAFYLYFGKSEVFNISGEEIEIFLESKEYEFDAENVTEFFNTINTKHD
jgi:hypothetical protein